MRFLLLLIPIFLNNFSCRKEPYQEGYYYIDNKSSNQLRIEASLINKLTVLETDKVNAFSQAFIYIARSGSGGHVLPSNFFTSFTVHAETLQGDSLMYQGVDNGDWLDEGIGKDKRRLTLIINE